MTYKTLEYNMNYPFFKQVTVPLESTYGIAVRIVKNGQVLPLLAQDDIVVNGQSGVGTQGTWQLFQLSSGSVPQTKMLSVNAYVPKDSTHYSMVGTQTLNANFPLSDAGLGDLARLDAPSTKLSAWFGGQQITADGDLVVSPEGKSALSDMYFLDTDAEPQVWVNAQLTAQTTEAIYTTDGGFVRAKGSVPASSTAEVRVVFDTDIDNGTENASFKLQVQEQDLGYIEI